MNIHCIESTIDLELPFGTVRLWLNRHVGHLAQLDYAAEESIRDAILTHYVETPHLWDYPAARREFLEWLCEIPNLNAVQVIDVAPGRIARFGTVIYTVPFTDVHG